MNTTLRIALCPGDRSMPLLSGVVVIEGCVSELACLPPEEIFADATAWDVCEMSLSSYCVSLARGDSSHVALPVFLSRSFRHSNILVRSDRVAAPQDLRGRSVGIPEYHPTALVWVRGLLQDDFGVAPEDIHWVTGGVERPGRRDALPIDLPPGVRIDRSRTDRSLVDQLGAGEIDAVIAPRVPAGMCERVPHVRPLFADARSVEREYFERTGCFPIMHVLGMRRSLAETQPTLPLRLMRAFVESKRVAARWLADTAIPGTMLPWAVGELEATQRIMGANYWPYGVAANRRTLEAFTRYLHNQHFTTRRLEIEELFERTTVHVELDRSQTVMTVPTDVTHRPGSSRGHS